MQIYKITQDSLTEADFDKFSTDEEGKYWMILSPEELIQRNDCFRFSYQTLNDCTNDTDMSKLEVYESYSFGILNIIHDGEDGFAVEELDFYLSKRFLLFVSEKDLSIFKEIREDIHIKGALSLSLEKILYNLIDKMTSRDNSVLLNIESEISDVEVDVIEGKTKDYINDIVSLKNRLLFLKRHYEPLLGTVEDLTENENEVLSSKSIAYFKILFNRIDRLNRKVGNLRDYVTQVRESYQAQLDLNLNNTMKLFTVITAIFLPLTLIVGWYGMNFKNMPELDWQYGYIFVIAMSISTLLISLWFFKKKNLM
ncbi:MAG: CorA family divalent cation transporter [Sedimentibacter sp.]|uniref:magnesium transporter CorA family protein n=1 Tax=Sedimentibacter sp. TaxID=1960295 RepID=UPI0031593C08